jgi:hypothetical protein
MAFFFALRRSSLLETNHRRRRVSLKMPLCVTALRKRLSRLSWDSPGFRSTDKTVSAPFLKVPGQPQDVETAKSALIILEPGKTVK